MTSANKQTISLHDAIDAAIKNDPELDATVTSATDAVAEYEAALNAMYRPTTYVSNSADVGAYAKVE